MSLAVVIVIVSATFLKRYTLQPSPGHPLILQERCFVLEWLSRNVDGRSESGCSDSWRRRATTVSFVEDEKVLKMGGRWIMAGILEEILFHFWI